MYEVLQSTNNMDRSRSWLGRLVIVGSLVAVSVDRCLNMKY
jgi:hypothetical protein